MTMKPEIKTLWADTLDSGRFKQATGCFIDSGDPGQRQHCCLAVLTELAIEAGLPDVRIDTDDRVWVHVVEGDDHWDPDGDDDQWIEYDAGDLPHPVREWAGLSSRNPIIAGVEAIARNDDNEESFAEIAAAIRRDASL